MRSSKRQVAVGLVTGLTLLGLLAWALWRPSPTPPALPAEYDLTSRPISLIPPGTVIGRTAPPGWSHLIVKSLPRVAAADRGEVSGLVARLASFLFTVTLAD